MHSRTQPSWSLYKPTLLVLCSAVLLFYCRNALVHECCCFFSPPPTGDIILAATLLTYGMIANLLAAGLLMTQYLTLQEEDVPTPLFARILMASTPLLSFYTWHISQHFLSHDHAKMILFFLERIGA